MKTFIKSLLLVSVLYAGAYYTNFRFNTPQKKTIKLIEKARTYIGVDYVYGGESYEGIDCSGLTKRSYDAIGVDLPRTSKDQTNVGVEVKLNEVAPGDLLFFESKDFHHVVLVTTKT
jgi:probable lipoprotein NlpC